MEKKMEVEASFDSACSSVKLARDQLSSNVSVDKSHSLVKRSKDPLEDSEKIQSLFSTVSFSRFDGFKHPSPFDIDCLDKDFIISQAMSSDVPTRTKAQAFPEIIESAAVYGMFEDVAHYLVRAFLAYLVDGFSEPNFQVEIQKLLMSARRSQKPGTGSKVVIGRCALSQTVEENALAHIGFPKTSTVGAMKLVALFLSEQEVQAQLGRMDELLALPPSSNLHIVLHCGVHC